MNILEKLKLGTDTYKDVDVPNIEGLKVRVKLLSEDDELQSVLAADNVFSGHKIEVQNIRKYDDEVETQMLYRCLKDPDTNKGIASNITDFRASMTPEIKEFFMSVIDDLKKEHSPNLNNMSEDEFDKLLEDLKKKPGTGMQ